MINLIQVSFLAIVAAAWVLAGWQFILPIAALIFIANKIWPNDDRPAQYIIEFVIYSFYTWIPAAGIGMLLGGTKQEQAQIGLIAIILINVWVIRYMNRKP